MVFTLSRAYRRVFLVAEIDTLFLHAMLLAAALSGIPLVASLLVGLFLSVVQAATQVQEQTLTFVPKLVTIGAVLYLCGESMFDRLRQFFLLILEELPGFA